MCPECKATVNVKECFKDRAALMELKVLSLLCRNHGCTWEGIADDYQVNYYVYACILHYIDCIGIVSHSQTLYQTHRSEEGLGTLH